MPGGSLMPPGSLGVAGRLAGVRGAVGVRPLGAALGRGRGAGAGPRPVPSSSRFSGSPSSCTSVRYLWPSSALVLYLRGKPASVFLITRSIFSRGMVFSTGAPSSLTRMVTAAAPAQSTVPLMRVPSRRTTASESSRTKAWPPSGSFSTGAPLPGAPPLAAGVGRARPLAAALGCALRGALGCALGRAFAAARRGDGARRQRTRPRSSRRFIGGGSFARGVEWDCRVVPLPPGGASGGLPRAERGRRWCRWPRAGGRPRDGPPWPARGGPGG